jgi:hypothetical protein
MHERKKFESTGFDPMTPRVRVQYANHRAKAPSDVSLSIYGT